MHAHNWKSPLNWRNNDLCWAGFNFFPLFFVKSLMERLKPSSLAVSIIFSGFAPKSLKRRKWSWRRRNLKSLYSWRRLLDCCIGRFFACYWLDSRTKEILFGIIRPSVFGFSRYQSHSQRLRLMSYSCLCWRRLGLGGVKRLIELLNFQLPEVKASSIKSVIASCFASKGDGLNQESFVDQPNMA